MKLETIYAEDVQFDYGGGTGGDAGLGFNARCPECKEMVRVAQHQWWSPICDCGYVWHVNISIEAEREKKGKQKKP